VSVLRQRATGLEVALVDASGHAAATGRFTIPSSTVLLATLTRTCGGIASKSVYVVRLRVRDC